MHQMIAMYFEFDFYNVFIKEHNLNNTNITSISCESTPLTTCKLIIQTNDETNAQILLLQMVNIYHLIQIHD